MKVLVLNNTVNYAGSNISFLKLAEGLKSEGVEFFMAGPKVENHFFEERLKQLNIEYRVIPVNSCVYPRISHFSHVRYIGSLLIYPFRLLKIFFKRPVVKNKLYSLINELKPDIIHTNTGVIREGVICGNKRGIPSIVHLREYQDLDFGFRIFPSKKKFESFLRTTNVISITYDIARHFNIIDYCRASVIYNGIMPKSAVTFNWPKENHFLCCSRISEKKGHEDVIRAFSQFSLCHKDYKLIILGSGDERYIQRLKNIASVLGCSNSIEWLGFSNKPFEYMKKAKALIVASYNEGFGRMTAEATFAGCITIGRNTAGTKEIINSTGGFFFEDEKGMIECMNAVAALESDAYHNIIKKGQVYAQDYFSTEANVEKTYNVYKRVISEKI